MSYSSYGSGNNNQQSANFYNLIKLKDPKDQPKDTIQTIVNDPYRANERAFMAGGWDGYFR